MNLLTPSLIAYPPIGHHGVEEADPHPGIFPGNTPLLFSHVEYARAAMELDEARDRARRQTERTTYE